MTRFHRVSLVAIVLLGTLGFAAGAGAQDAGAAVVHLSTERPKALVPLYASFGVLQVMDMHSTWTALDSGSVEANPLLKGVAGNQLGLVAVKGAGAAAVIAVSERLYKKNRTAAVLLMVVSNSAMACVVEHNYRAVR